MISIIIPTLNEEMNLGRAIEAARKSSSEAEFIVVDGGSSDGTVRCAEGAGARVIRADKALRARQMNTGGAAATGSVLLFLHADTLLPGGGLDRMSERLRDRRVVGGAFARRFDTPSSFLKLTCLLAEGRNRIIGWHLGDQAMFVRRRVFEEMGGFREMRRFEDLDFSRRLGRQGKLVTVRPAVVSSGRRFARGAWGRTWGDVWLTMRYMSGRES